MNAPTPQERPFNAPGRATPQRPAAIYIAGAEGRGADVPSFTITIRPIPGNWLGTIETRLRHALKSLSRGYGFQCLSIREITLSDAAANKQEETKQHE